MLRLIEAAAIGMILGFLGLGAVLLLLALGAGAVIGAITRRRARRQAWPELPARVVWLTRDLRRGPPGRR